MGKRLAPTDLEGARQRVIDAAKELEEPFDAGDDCDLGRLMDALLWLRMVEGNVKAASGC